MMMNDRSFLEFDIAFQPIIDAASGRIYSQEAMVRGKCGETAQALLLSINSDQLAQADATFRQEAIRIAGMAGLDTLLSVNLMPSVLENSADAMNSTLETAALYHVSGEQLLLQITESEIIVDPATFAKRSDDLRQAGLKLAIDDFGAGYAGLNLLADFQPEVVKLDKRLVRGIERHGPRQAIVRGIARTCSDLGIDIIAEGIETAEEYFWFLDEGITLFQGPLLARPSLGTLSKVFKLPK
jgi:EAL domain-containing protein (putative c-di-GMP-specific phosphodiesterase class I)